MSFAQNAARQLDDATWPAIRELYEQRLDEGGLLGSQERAIVATTLTQGLGHSRSIEKALLTYRARPDEFDRVALRDLLGGLFRLAKA